MDDSLDPRLRSRDTWTRRLRRTTGWSAVAVVVAVAAASAAVGQLLPGRHLAGSSVPTLGASTGSDDGGFSDGGAASPVTLAPAGAVPAATSGAS
ncbi:MAG TPA: hypothetical protein VMW47_03300 [Verrucomicrobiae bacterium]|nr:hypothetical protein [Verrucomicrobiae bacterium]